MVVLVRTRRKYFIRFLNQFFILFPEYKNNSFYIFGESYGGKYVTGIGYYLLKSNTTLRFDGIGIGSGILDPRNQQLHANYLYQLGIIDKNARKDMLKKEKLFRELIDGKKFTDAFYLKKNLTKEYELLTGYKNLNNYLDCNYDKIYNYGDYENFLNDNEVRKGLHVGNVTRNTDVNITETIARDMMKTVKKWLEYVIERKRTLLYFGQMDLISSYSGAMNFIKKLNWTRSSKFHNSQRKYWRINGKLAGFIKTDNMFTEVMIRNAGHRISVDQPYWTFNLYNKFIFRNI